MDMRKGNKVGMEVRKRVDVIIPVYRPDKKFARLLRMLSLQTYPVNRIIVMNTERSFWNDRESKVWRFII